MCWRCSGTCEDDIVDSEEFVSDLPDPLQAGREAYAARAWQQARTQLLRADSEAPLRAEDLDRLAVAACLAGMTVEAVDSWTRAHRSSAEQGDIPFSVRCAFWVAFSHLMAGDLAVAGGWIKRAQRMLDDAGAECVEQGYVRFLLGLRAIFSGDASSCHAEATQVVKTGLRFGDADLVTFGRLLQGRGLIYLGEPAEGAALLDEGMVAVAAGELSPIVAGNS